MKKITLRKLITCKECGNVGKHFIATNSGVEDHVNVKMICASCGYEEKVFMDRGLIELIKSTYEALYSEYEVERIK